MNRLPILFLTAMIFFFSCEKVEKTIPVLNLRDAFSSEKKVRLDEVATNVRFVQLETTDDVLINNINKVFMYADFFVVIYDIYYCSLFDLDGKHIRKIGQRGDGPEEYMYVSNIFVEGDNIILYDGGKGRFLKYKLTGEFVDSEALPARFSQVNLFSPDIYAGFIGNASGKEPTCMKFFDSKMTVIDSIPYHFTYEKPDPNILMGFGMEGVIYSQDKTVRFKNAYNDTLFTITKDFQLLPTYIFDLGSSKFTAELRYQTTSGPRDPNLQGKKTLYPVFESKRYLLLSGWGFELGKYVFWDKELDALNYVSFHYTEEQLSKLDKEDSVCRPSFISMDNKTMIAFERSESIENDNNPVLVLATLKD
ncbi:6-bladed beta-propeller [Parabacteroides sp. OttesenSCG-928-G07]|nr:6-bladed beta-propeller [Parabacteroides sp. OttesenSCG-928-G21]MDL2277183.1 6-bladed beta-propeller [Parabacteroides sp. OttesenSCG-928-G07]